MERINTPKSRGMNSHGLRVWAMLIMMLGILGRGILQNRILGLGEATNMQMLESLLSTDAGMTAATVSLVFQALETMAAPLFCFLLVEGAQYTGNIMKYLGRVAGVAVLSELPYNLAMSGRVLDLSSRNPAFGLLLALILLVLYQKFSRPGFMTVLLKLLFTLSAVLWCSMLKVVDGECVVILTAVLWLFRHKPLYRNIMGCTAAFACCMVNPFYMVSPMSFLMLHFYNGEKGEENRLFNYLFYPVGLLLVGLAGVILL